MSLLGKLRREEGFTIVEMMVVVTILGFLATVSATLVTILFTANLRSSQLGSQQTTIENTFGFFSARLALVQYGDLGVPDPDSAGVSIDPLSLAGDQIMFTSTFDSDSSAGQTCFRVAYLAELGEVRIASKPGSCSSVSEFSTPDAPTLFPRRGPNAYLFGAKEAGGSDQKEFYLPGESLFDPVIDSAYPQVQAACAASPGGDAGEDCEAISLLRPWTLSRGLEGEGIAPARLEAINEGEESLAGGEESNFAFPESEGFLPLFAFIRREGSTLPFNAEPRPPLVAGAPGALGGSATWFQSAAGEIGGISVQALVRATAQDQGFDEKVRPRFYEQRYSLQQLCSIFETGGQFDPSAGGDLDGPYAAPQIAAGAIDWENFGPDAFPSDRVERTSSATVGGEWVTLLEYGSDDVAAAEEMPPGRYLLFASVTESTVLDNNSATAVEIALVQNTGAASETLASTSSGAWPLSLSGVAINLSPETNQQIVLRARAKNPGTEIPASPSLPVRLDLYWLGAPG